MTNHPKFTESHDSAARSVGYEGAREIRVISLWQPWAQWVSLQWKTIETRLHDRFAGLVGHRIGIHAALKWDNSAMELAAPYMSDFQKWHTEDFLRIGGAIICTALVAESRKLSAADSRGAMIDCEKTQRNGLILRDVKIIPAIPCKGKQGIWIYRGAVPDASTVPDSERERNTFLLSSV